MVDAPIGPRGQFPQELRTDQASGASGRTEQASGAGSAVPRQVDGATVAHFTPASPSEQHTGLLGYVRLRYGDLVLDGLTLRRTAAGRLTVSYPARRDRQGGRHAYFQPADEEKRAEFERWFLEVCKRSGGEL